MKEEVLITGSTEENFPVTVTGLGLTVIGKINLKIWKFPQIKKNDIAVVIGKPMVGEEVLNDKGEILTLDMLLKIKNMQMIDDILPVGSKGILYEANEMARTSGLKFYMNDNIELNINASAGPATCAIVAIAEDFLNELQENIDIPICKIGRFK